MKKAVSFIGIFTLAAILFSSFGTVAAGAVSIYTARDVTAHVFTLGDTITIGCLFKSDLPEIVYIDPVDYLNVIYKDKFTESRGKDGTYTVTNA